MTLFGVVKIRFIKANEFVLVQKKCQESCAAEGGAANQKHSFGSDAIVLRAEAQSATLRLTLEFACFQNGRSFATEISKMNF